MPSPHGVGVVTGMRAATIALASLRTCVAIAEASPDVGTETSGLHLDSCPCPLELHVAARDIRSRGPFLECERGRLQHAELVGAGANHLARLAGERRIGGERRRSTQRIPLARGGDRPSCPSIERNWTPRVDNFGRAVARRELP